MVMTRGQIRREENERRKKESALESDRYRCASMLNDAYIDQKIKSATWINAETVYELATAYSRPWSYDCKPSMSKDTFLREIYEIIGMLNWDPDYNENWDKPNGSEYKIRICPRRKKQTLMIYRIKF